MILIALGILLFVSLVFVESVRPKHSKLTVFELRRRHSMKDSRATEALEREKQLTILGQLRLYLVAFILILLSMIAFLLYGWRTGILSMFLVVLLSGYTSRQRFAQRVANKLFERYESRVLAFIAKHKKKMSWLTGKTSLPTATLPVGSHEELFHLIDTSDVFSNDEKRLVESALLFKNLTVSDVMTKRRDMVTVTYSEVLGPLVLDDLHKTGQTLFPVVKGEEIVGLLDSSDHKTLRTKESPRVRDVMYTEISRIDHNEQLESVLKTFMNSNVSLLFVTDDNDEIVGMVGLSDVLRALMGWNRR